MRRVALVMMVLAVAISALTGCSVGATTLIGGQVFGEPTGAPGSGHDIVALHATVKCNNTSAQAGSDGKYSLRVSPANSYTCTASALHYTPQTTTISGAGDVIELDFGAPQSQACGPVGDASEIECPALTILRGSLKGVVSYSGGGHAGVGITVACAPTDGSASTPDSESSLWVSTKTDANGAYTLKSVLPGDNGCIAQTDAKVAAYSAATIPSNNTAKLNFTLCQRHCPPVRYHLGNVMHSYTAYLIYWLPASATFEPHGSDSRFESLTQRYFQDIGGTSFYNLLTQYWDYQGYIRNSAKLGGTFVDTSAYQKCDESFTHCAPVAATKSAPLQDNDIQAEIARALKAHPSWQVGPDTEFVVLTGYGAEECVPGKTTICSFNHGANGFCGYHSAFDGAQIDKADTAVIYAYIPDPANDGAYCTGGGGGFPTPNGDATADLAITIMSHEQFESVSDPNPGVGAWYDDALPQSENEIADKCESNFGSIGADGGNVTLAHGHRYLLQAEWSNRSNGCAFK